MGICCSKKGGESKSNNSVQKQSGEKEKDWSRGDIPSAAQVGQLRHQADLHAKKRNELFSESQQAYQQGDGKKAKDLSNRGKEESAMMEECHKKAASITFNEKNLESGEYRIDLHGLRVREAMFFFGRQLIKVGNRKGQVLLVIPGAGHHSEGGVAKIKPEVISELKRLGFSFTEVAKGGAVEVKLGTGHMDRLKLNEAEAFK